MDGFVDYIDRNQGIDPAWRDSVLRFTRARMLLHRHPRRWSRRCARCRARARSSRMDELEALEVPALVVASHDAADPGHPYAVAAAYAERLPRARLVSEERGESPLAWQGGRLSREIAAFYAEALSSSPMKFPTEARLRRIIAFVAALGIGVATYITIADSGGGAPTCLAGGGGCETVANSSYSHIAGVNVAVFGIVGYVALLAERLLRQRPGPLRRLRRRARRLRLQRLPDLPGDLQDRSDLPVVRRQRRADDDPLPAQRHPPDWLRRDHGRRGPRKGLNGARQGGPMSNKKDREKRREERLQEETKVDAGERRTRLLQFGAGAVFLVIVAVVVLIVASSGGSGGDATNLKEVSAVDSLVGGSPQNEMVLGKPKAKVELIEYGDLQCPICKEYSEEVLPQVIENKVDGGEAKISFNNFTIIGAAVGAGRSRGARRRRPGPRLELPRALLPQPGRGELRLRDRRIPRSGRQSAPASRTSPNGTRNARAKSSPTRSRKRPNRRRPTASPERRRSRSRARAPTASNSSAPRRRPRNSKKRSKRPAERPSAGAAGYFRACRPVSPPFWSELT